MKYSRCLTNPQLMLLEILAENGPLSGYRIDALVAYRGYREWTEVGTTSIYQGLEKLRSKGLVAAAVDHDKTGRGPLPRVYRMTALGRRSLESELVAVLSDSRERDRSFDLGLAGLPFLAPAVTVKALRERKVMLDGAGIRIRDKYSADGGGKLPFHTRAVFRHPLHLMRAEQVFVDWLISHLQKAARHG